MLARTSPLPLGHKQLVRAGARRTRAFPLLMALGIAASGCTPGLVVSQPSMTPATSEGSRTASASAVVPPTTPTPGSWTLVATTLAIQLPTGTSRAVAFPADRSALLAGGLTTAGTTSIVLAIRLPNGPITSAGHLATAVHDAGGALLDSGPLVVGGGGVSPLAVVQDLASQVGQLPLPRADLAAVRFGNQLVVVAGGTPARLDPTVLATTDGSTFTASGSLAVAVRYPAVAVAQGMIIVVGGTDGTHDRDEIQAIDPTAGTVRVIGRLPHGLSHAMALVVGGHLLVAGGRVGGQAQDAIFSIDPTTGIATVVGRLPSPMSDGAPVVVDGVGYLIGGEDGGLRRSIIELMQS